MIQWHFSSPYWLEAKKFLCDNFGWDVHHVYEIMTVCHPIMYIALLSVVSHRLNLLNGLFFNNRALEKYKASNLFFKQFIYKEQNNDWFHQVLALIDSIDYFYVPQTTKRDFALKTKEENQIKSQPSPLECIDKQNMFKNSIEFEWFQSIEYIVSDVDSDHRLQHVNKSELSFALCVECN